MSRDFFGIENGLDIYATNGALQLRLLTGTAAPTGAVADQSAAPIGSLYVRSGIGEIYQKILNNGNSGDWLLSSNSAVSVGKWRGGVKALTADVIAAGTVVRNLTTTPFSDDNAPLLTSADFLVNDLVIGGSATAPILKRVSVVASPSITLVDADYPISNDDTFIVDNYLPDPAGGEGKAIANYNGTLMVKVGDFDWSLATGINLSGAYVAAAGNPLANDTIEAALAKIDGNLDSVNTLTGIAQGVTTLGTWASPVDLLFTASTSIKVILQRIGDLLMQLRGVQVTGITTSTMVDQVPIASVNSVKWVVNAFEIATPANRVALEVHALNDGTSAVDDTVFSKLKVGAALNFTVLVDISSGNMRLMCASTSGGVTVTARRTEVVKSLL